LFFQGGLFSLDGSQAKQIEEVVSLQNAKGLGIQSAKKILDQGGASLMDEIKSQLSK
jgi:hydroxymethylbilane synthase